MRRRVPAVPRPSKLCTPHPQTLVRALPPATGTNRRPARLKMARSTAIPASPPPRQRPAPRSARAPATATAATRGGREPAAQRRRRWRGLRRPSLKQSRCPECQLGQWCYIVVCSCSVSAPYCACLFRLLSLRCDLAVWSLLYSILECVSSCGNPCRVMMAQMES